MEYWVILDYDTVVGLVAAPADWEDKRVLAAWCKMHTVRSTRALQAEKWQIETLKE